MKVFNTHERLLRADTDQVAALLDSLASAGDRLWPRESWPAMRFDRPLGVGARGGHGPIRYQVVEYLPGQRVRFRFDAPRGFDGGHGFEVVPEPGGIRLRHTLEMEARGPALLSWPLLFRPLHDALLEDALATGQESLGIVPDIVPWSPRVRLLRWVVSGGRARPQLRPGKPRK